MKFKDIKLKGLRLSDEVTQVELADRMGVAQPNISNIESADIMNLSLWQVEKYLINLGYNVTINLDKRD